MGHFHLHTHTHTRIRTHIYAHTHTHTHTHTRTHTHKHTHANTHTCHARLLELGCCRGNSQQCFSELFFLQFSFLRLCHLRSATDCRTLEEKHLDGNRARAGNSCADAEWEGSACSQCLFVWSFTCGCTTGSFVRFWAQNPYFARSVAYVCGKNVFSCPPI